MNVIIIGGGASGMACAVFLKRKNHRVTVLERGDRLGKKLSSTGNGQGNVTNINMGAEHYFSDDMDKVARALKMFGYERTIAFLQSMGGVFLPDGRGRVYPYSRQASAVTDLFRRELTKLGADMRTDTYVKKINHSGNGFEIVTEKETLRADAVVLAMGGKAAPHFGTDGNGYEIARSFGHTVTECAPSLVQLKCDNPFKSLTGLRVDAGATLKRGDREIYSCRGDILFVAGGISGDCTFKLSSYAKAGDVVEINFLPDLDVSLVQEAAEKRDLLCIAPNVLARAVLAKAKTAQEITRLLTRFPLKITGDFGFSRAQVTKGGVPLKETDDYLMSRFFPNLFFTGEILNVDGECGGYNLQWAFTSAYLAAEGMK